MIYPETRRVDVVEERFGVAIFDPYRWLESDGRSSPNVAAWMVAQDQATRAYLAGLPGRDAFRERLTALFDHERLTAPQKRGERSFFMRNAGLNNQDVLVLREGSGRPDQVLIDPNGWSDDGATALAEWSPSEDGALLAFAVQNGGTDWRTIRVLNVATGAWLADEIERVRFTSIAWAKDGSGFFYSCFPEPEKDARPEAPVAGHAAHFHVLGASQKQDRLVHSTPRHPHVLHMTSVSEDGRYAFIYSTPGSSGSTPTIVDLSVRPQSS